MSRKRSEVWMHFEVLSDNSNKAICNYCKNTFSIAGGSLGNLSRHLKKMHPTISVKRSEQASNLDAKASTLSQNFDDAEDEKMRHEGKSNIYFLHDFTPTKNKYL